jgi:hypothetical protein
MVNHRTWSIGHFWGQARLGWDALMIWQNQGEEA